MTTTTTNSNALVLAVIPSHTCRRQLVFAAITGDPWNYMGSRRLSWDIERGTTYTAGLNWTDIDQVCAFACSHFFSSVCCCSSWLSTPLLIKARPPSSRAQPTSNRQTNFPTDRPTAAGG